MSAESPAKETPGAHLHQALREEATVAPQLSAQPAPRGSLAHLSDHVPGRQTQLTLLLRTVTGQNQHLCGQKRGSEGPSQGRLALARVRAPCRRELGGGGGLFFLPFPHGCVEDPPQTFRTYPSLPGRPPEPAGRLERSRGQLSTGLGRLGRAARLKQKRRRHTRIGQVPLQVLRVGVGEGAARLSRFGPQPRGEESKVSGQC